MAEEVAIIRRWIGNGVGEIRIPNDLIVKRVGFGGAWLTGPGTYGPPPDLAVACNVVRRAADVGIQLFDTADCYGPETSELLIAEALHPYPDDLAISTKGGRLALGNNQWQPDGRPEHLTRACEASLKRLRPDAIDLYQLNAVDPAVPLEESLGALLQLREEGKIRRIGICNVSAEDLSQAQSIAPISSVQDRYDLFTRSNEAVLQLCEDRGIPFLAWFPPSNDIGAPQGSALARIAHHHGVKPTQVALAWLIGRSPSVIPLPGTVNPDWYEEDLASLEITLTTDDMEQISSEAGPC